VPVSCHFHRATLTGLIANFLIVPILGYGAVVAGFSALASLYLLPPLGEILLKIAAFLVKLSTSILLALDGNHEKKEQPAKRALAHGIEGRRQEGSNDNDPPYGEK